MRYIDLGIVDNDCRVTFEAENNLDFRLGTGPLRYSELAAEGDIAAITRTREMTYELRLYRQGTAQHKALMPYAVNLIGHQGKKYGYMPNAEFSAVAKIKIGTKLAAH